MGGYGTVRIAMKHPATFSAMYAMSPCCMSARGAPSPEEGLKLEALKTPEEAASLGFFVRATLAVSSAWSPNPKNPPFYMDLPTKGGVAQPDVIARWAASQFGYAPATTGFFLAMLPQLMIVSAPKAVNNA